MDCDQTIVSDVPERLRLILEEVVRVSTEEGYCVIGAVFSSSPMSIAIMRNTSDDTVKVLRATTDLVEKLLKNKPALQISVAARAN